LVVGFTRFKPTLGSASWGPYCGGACPVGLYFAPNHFNSFALCPAGLICLWFYHM
jgi:hypothetical protein